jgi:hypothetical protein
VQARRPLARLPQNKNPQNSQPLLLTTPIPRTYSSSARMDCPLIRLPPCPFDLVKVCESSPAPLMMLSSRFRFLLPPRVSGSRSPVSYDSPFTLDERNERGSAGSAGILSREDAHLCFSSASVCKRFIDCCNAGCVSI